MVNPLLFHPPVNLWVDSIVAVQGFQWDVRPSCVTRAINHAPKSLLKSDVDDSEFEVFAEELDSK